MGHLVIELRCAKSLDLGSQAPFFGFYQHFFTSRLVDIPAEQHNMIFS